LYTLIYKFSIFLECENFGSSETEMLFSGRVEGVHTSRSILSENYIETTSEPLHNLHTSGTLLSDIETTSEEESEQNVLDNMLGIDASVTCDVKKGSVLDSVYKSSIRHLQKSRSYYKTKLNELKSIKKINCTEDLQSLLGIPLTDELGTFLFYQIKKIKGESINISDTMKLFALALYKLVGKKG